MRDYLIIKLHGPMQAWGRETFEGLRPSDLFPGRSALLGLLGACLGVERTDSEHQQSLASSVAFAVRVDKQGQKMTDYHTVKNARVNYQGLKSHETIQTWREYWQDAAYTVAVWSLEQAPIDLAAIQQALMKPVYTPFLGRRSCPITRPLFAQKISAENALSALAQESQTGGTIYSEENSQGAIPMKKRNVPIIHQPRQFASHTLYMSTATGEAYVPE